DCAGARWSCALDVPNATANLTGLTIHVSEAGTDNQALALNPDPSGFLVDTVAPGPATINVPNPALIGSAGPNPPTVTGTREAAATVVVSITGTTRGALLPVSGTCAPNTSSTNWTCSASQ